MRGHQGTGAFARTQDLANLDMKAPDDKSHHQLLMNRYRVSQGSCISSCKVAPCMLPMQHSLVSKSDQIHTVENWSNTADKATLLS